MVALRKLNHLRVGSGSGLRSRSREKQRRKYYGSQEKRKYDVQNVNSHVYNKVRYNAVGHALLYENCSKKIQESTGITGRPSKQQT